MSDAPNGALPLPVDISKTLQKLYNSDVHPLTITDDPERLRNILKNFGVHRCSKRYFNKLLRKCSIGEMALAPRFVDGEPVLAAHQRTLSFQVIYHVWSPTSRAPHRVIPLSLGEYRRGWQGKWVRRKHAHPSETFGFYETDIVAVLARALHEELGLDVDPKHLTESHVQVMSGIKMNQDILSDEPERDYHQSVWSPRFYVNNIIYRCLWLMPKEYFDQKGYRDSVTGNRFIWHYPDGTPLYGPGG